MEQKPPPAPPQPKKIKCPKCKHIQILRPICENCGFDIRGYALELKKKREKEAELSQKQPEKPPISTPPPTTPPTSSPSPPAPPPSSAKPAFKLPFEAVPIVAELSGIKELFEETWELYKKRFVTLLLILLASTVIALLSLGVPIGTGFLLAFLLPSLKVVFIAVGGIVSAVSLPVVLSWGTTAFIFAAADETLNVSASLKKGWGKLWSFMWLASIVGFVVIGGHLLFLIPGVIFSVWFAFSAYVFAVEDKRGMDAALMSKEYVRGRWGEVFIRLFLLGVVSTVISIVPIVGPILSLLFMPYTALFAYLIYSELKGIREVMYHPSSGQKCKWVAVGALGYIVAPIIITLLLGALLMGILMSVFGAMSSGMGIKGLPALSMPWQKTEIEGIWAGFREGNYIDGRDVMLKVKGGTLELSGADVKFSGLIRLDEKAEPRQIDITLTATPDAGFVGQTSLGIYGIGEGAEGEELRLCARQPGQTERPASFGPGGDIVCFVFTRWKDEENLLAGMLKSLALWEPSNIPSHTGAPDYPVPSQTITASPTPATPSSELEGRWSDREITLHFKGGEVEFGESAKGLITLNEKTSPKQIDIYMTKSPDRKEIGKTVFGIYSVEGGRLLLCTGEIGKVERPSSFAPTEKNSCLTLKRTGNIGPKNSF